MIQLDKLLQKHSILGIAGSRSTGKTLMVLASLKELRRKYPQLNIVVLGCNIELKRELSRYNITMLFSKMDILDLRLRDTIIFIDEIGLLFPSRNRNKNQDKLMRFIDRIEHQNCKLIVGTAREGYWNKFSCSRINAFLVKTIDFDSLVNGTWLNERVRAIDSTSDYRAECDVSECFYVSNDGTITEKMSFEYCPEFDTKKENIDLFGNENKIDTTPTLKNGKIVPVILHK